MDETKAVCPFGRLKRSFGPKPWCDLVINHFLAAFQPVTFTSLTQTPRPSASAAADTLTPAPSYTHSLPNPHDLLHCACYLLARRSLTEDTRFFTASSQPRPDIPGPVLTTPLSLPPRSLQSPSPFHLLAPFHSTALLPTRCEAGPLDFCIHFPPLPPRRRLSGLFLINNVSLPPAVDAPASALSRTRNLFARPRCPAESAPGLDCGPATGRKLYVFDCLSMLALTATVKYFLLSAPVDWTRDQYIRRFLLPTGEYVSCVSWSVRRLIATPTTWPADPTQE